MTIITLLKPPHVFSETISLTALFDIVNGSVSATHLQMLMRAPPIMPREHRWNKNRLFLRQSGAGKKVCKSRPLSCKLVDLAEFGAEVNSRGRSLWWLDLLSKDISGVYHAPKLSSRSLCLSLCEPALAGWKTALRKFHYRVGFPCVPAIPVQKRAAHTFEISLKIHQEFQI